MRLNNSNLDRLPARLKLPGYRRAKLANQAGIAHIGVGAFHRAHQQVYYQRLLQLDAQADCAVVGINLRSESSKLLSALAEQDCLYTLSAYSTDNSVTHSVMGALLRVVDACSDLPAALAELSQPRIRIVTTTVTEAGYYLKVNGDLDTSNPDIASDLSQGSCNSLYALLLQALSRRFAQSSSAPLSLLCCDNITHNGAMLRSGLQQYFDAAGQAKLWSRIVDQLSFPSSMVDRIAPRALEQSQRISSEFGLRDDCAVLSEDYLQWVVEDNFIGGRPALERVGVDFSAEVGAWESMKLRVLNACHLAIGFMGSLRGYSLVDQALNDPEVSQFAEHYLQQEAVPALSRAPVDGQQYSQLIIQRFRNQHLRDTTRRVAMDARDKIPNFVLPTLEANLQAQRSCAYAAKLIALWFMLLRADNTNPEPIYDDPHKHKLQQLTAGENGFSNFISSSWLWGTLAQADSFRSALQAAYPWALQQASKP